MFHVISATSVIWKTTYSQSSLGFRMFRVAEWRTHLSQRNLSTSNREAWADSARARSEAVYNIWLNREWLFRYIIIYTKTKYSVFTGYSNYSKKWPQFLRLLVFFMLNQWTDNLNKYTLIFSRIFYFALFLHIIIEKFCRPVKRWTWSSQQKEDKF